MRFWWTLNPEYEYMFITDEQAAVWLYGPSSPCSAQETTAYRSLRLGAQKADLLRSLICKYSGCVYADLDSVLLRPLREIIPRDASAVAPTVWPMDWLMYEAAHPIIERFAALQTRLILEQVLLLCCSLLAALLCSPVLCSVLVTVLLCEAMAFDII